MRAPNLMTPPTTFVIYAKSDLTQFMMSQMRVGILLIPSKSGTVAKVTVKLSMFMPLVLKKWSRLLKKIRSPSL